MRRLAATATDLWLRYVTHLVWGVLNRLPIHSTRAVFLAFSKDEFWNLVEASGRRLPRQLPLYSVVRWDFKQKIAVGFTAQWRRIIDYWAKTGKGRCFSLCSSSVAAGQMGFVFANSTLWRKNNHAEGGGRQKTTDEVGRNWEVT